MTEDEKMFHIGLWAFGAVLALTIVLQVCYRTQNKARDRVRREIVMTQQKSAELEANFASYVRPEILRNIVVGIYPNSEVISFHKNIGIDALPRRENDV
ncbi:hypothetical protein HDR61_01255 [bacterium]|nr:hypothetical protein [bacterium]